MQLNGCAKKGVATVNHINNQLKIHFREYEASTVIIAKLEKT